MLEQQIQLSNEVRACVIGQLLFCVHACCRWKDAQRLKAIKLEQGQSESLLHADALSSKTALTVEAKTKFLPYVAIGAGISSQDWARRWLDARQNQGLQLDDFALLSYSFTSDWTRNPMSSSEATFWLREVLQGICEPGDLLQLGSHSCKTTVLTWAGRCNHVNFIPSERRLLGQHLDPHMKSVMTYSREAYPALYAKVFQTYVKVRSGEFNPDLPAVDRILETRNDHVPECCGFGF